MMQWEIPLQSNHGFRDIELRRWLNLFDSPACKVAREEAGSYYLTACRFEKLSDYDEALDSANNLITMMKAISKIDLGTDFQSNESDDEDDISCIRERVGDSIANVYSREELKVVLIEVATVEPTVKIEQDEEIIPQQRQERWYDYYLDQCDDWVDGTVVFNALSYFAQKTEARTVRLTYETILKDEGGKYPLLKNNNWVTEKELSRFTCSLNRRDIDSPELHVTNTDPKCNMNITEVKTFLAERLLKPWLIKKRERYKLEDGVAAAKYLSTMLGI